MHTFGSRTQVLSAIPEMPVSAGLEPPELCRGGSSLPCQVAVGSGPPAARQQQGHSDEATPVPICSLLPHEPSHQSRGHGVGAGWANPSTRHVWAPGQCLLMTPQSVPGQQGHWGPPQGLARPGGWQWRKQRDSPTSSSGGRRLSGWAGLAWPSRLLHRDNVPHGPGALAVPLLSWRAGARAALVFWAKAGCDPRCVTGAGPEPGNSPSAGQPGYA